MKISVVLEMLTANFETDAKRAEKAMDRAFKEMEQTAKRAGVAIGAGLVAGATAMAALTKRAIDTADQINKMAQSTGASVEKLSAFKFAIEQSGGSLESLAKGMQKLAKDAAAGGDVLARAGVSAKNAAGEFRPVEDLLLDVADKFSLMRDGAEKAAYAQQLFGKSGADLIPFLNQGKAGIKELTDQAERLGLVIDKDTAAAAERFNDALDALKMSAVGVGNDIARTLLPKLVELTEAAVDFVERIRADGTLAAWGEAIKTAAGYVDELAVFITTRLVAGALVSLGTSLIATTGSFTAATVAANAFRLALALVGGPVGIAVTAVAGLAVALYNQEDAADRARRASDEYKKVLDGVDVLAKESADKAMDYAVALKAEALAHLENAKAILEEKRAKSESANASYAAFAAAERGDMPEFAASVAADELAEAALAATNYANRIDDLNGKIAELSVNDAFERLREGADGAKPPVVVLTSTLSELRKAEEEAAKRAAEHADAMQSLANAARDYASASDPVAQALDEYADAVLNLVAEAEKAKATGEDWAKVEKLLEAAVLGAQGALEKKLATIRATLTPYQEYIADLQAERDLLSFQASLIGLSADAQARATAAFDAHARVMQFANQQAENGNELSQAQIDNLIRLEEQLGANRVAVQEAARAAEEADRAWSDFADGLADAVLDGSDGVKRYFKRLLDDLKRELIASGLTTLFRSIFNVGGSGAGSTSLLGMLFGGGGGGGLNLGSIFSGLFGGGTLASAPPSAWGPFLPGASAASGGAGSLISGSGLSTSFAGVPIIGWIAAAAALNTNLFSAGWRPSGGSLTLPDGQTVRGGGGTIGRVADTSVRLAFPGIAELFSDRTISLIAGSAAFVRLFGRKAPELTGTTTSFNFGEEFSASALFRTLERGGLFRSDRRRERTGELSDEAIASGQAIFDQLSAVVANAADRLKGEAPALLDASLRIVEEFDSKGKLKSTKYLVEALGRTWEEATAELATTRLSAENIVHTIDSILGTTATAAADVITDTAAEAFDEAGNRIAGTGGRLADSVDFIVKSIDGATGEASAIAERWRDDAETLMDGAQFLLAAAQDIRAGAGLLGEGGTLTQITELIEDLQAPGEALAETYARVATATALLTDAMELQGTTLDLSREAFVRFATDIADAAGGIERAQSLWEGYFGFFFSETERLALARDRAGTSAASEFGDIGLNVNDFAGDGGAARFRAAFEAAQVAGLTAEATVEWLEAGNALAAFTRATEAFNASIGEAAESTALADIMASVEEGLSEFALPQSVTERMATLTEQTDELIRKAEGLGATEEQIAQIRELGQARMNVLLEEQAASIAAMEAASGELASLLGNLAAEAAGEVTPYTSALQSLTAQYQEHVQRINDLAIASGRAGASASELAVATDWYRAAQSRLIAELFSAAQSIIGRLNGTSLGGASAGGGGFSGGGGADMSGIDAVNAAVEDRYSRELGYLEQIENFLNGLDLSALSPLTPQERLSEAQQQYETLLAAAQGGDLDALEQLQGAAQAYLQEAQGFFGGVGAYSGIFEGVQDALQALVDRGPLNAPLTGSGSTGGSAGSGGGGMTVEAGESFVQLSELERYTLSTELTGILRDLIAATGSSLVEISEQLGLDLAQFVTDLGVDLNELTATTAGQLADISRGLGVELSELASAVGADLGTLADDQSLLNDALEAAIATVPEQFRDEIQGYLTAIETATNEADANAAIAAAEAAINLLPASIRDLLAPFFDGVDSPTDVLLETTIAQANDIAAIRSLIETDPNRRPSDTGDVDKVTPAVLSQEIFDSLQLQLEAVEAVTAAGPREIAVQLSDYLIDIEEAADRANALGAIAVATAAINELPASIADLLAPFSNAAGLDLLVTATQGIASDVSAIYALLAGPPPEGESASDVGPPPAAVPASAPQELVSQTVSDTRALREELADLRAEIARGNRNNERLLSEIGASNHEIARKTGSSAGLHSRTGQRVGG